MALTEKELDLLSNYALKPMMENMRGHHYCAIKSDDMLKLIVPPNLREPLTIAAKNVTLGYSTPTAAILQMQVQDIPGAAAVRFNWLGGYDDMPFLIPRNFKLQPDADQVVLARIYSYVTEYSKLSQQWRLAQSVLVGVEKRCETLQQMRFLFPGVVSLFDHLVTMHDRVPKGLQERFERVRAAKVPSEVPKLPTELRIAAKNATNLINSSKLVGKPPERPNSRTWVVNVEKCPPIPLPWNPAKSVAW
jgi:hypothetical protein